MPLPPCAATSSRVAAQSLMSAAITRAPVAARLRANSWPRPRAAPVIATTLSRKSISTSRNGGRAAPTVLAPQPSPQFTETLSGEIPTVLLQHLRTGVEKGPLPGLDPGIHVFAWAPLAAKKDVGGRVKPGHGVGHGGFGLRG